LLAGAVALLALAVGQELAAARRVRAAPIGGAVWIWAADAAVEDGPQVFYAVRDLELAFQPTTAEVALLADEEYWLSVNGASVGAGRWTPGAPLDRYEIGRLLAPGRNRLAVELRSARGAGGLIARVEAAGEGQRVSLGTDATWRIVRDHERSLLLPASEAPAGDPPRIWGPAPLGRWGAPEEGDLVPRLDRLRRSRRPSAPRALRLGVAGPWQAVPRARPTRPLGPWVVFDWGTEVVGYLSLAIRPGDEMARGLLWTDSAPPGTSLAVDPRLDPYAAVVLGAPGRTWWTDTRPRRFRYAYVLGLDQITGAEVYPVHADRAAALLAPRSPLAGLWGLEPPRLATPVEDEVWRELQGLAGVTEGQVP
jgi:hypothetical protein